MTPLTPFSPSSATILAADRLNSPQLLHASMVTPGAAALTAELAAALTPLPAGAFAFEAAA